VWVRDGERMLMRHTCCSDRFGEAIAAIRSAVLLNAQCGSLEIHVFHDSENGPRFRAEYESWPEDVLARVRMHLYDVDLESGWMNIEVNGDPKPCASARLFFPDRLQHLDVLLYTDTDVLFLIPPRLVVEELARSMSAETVSVMATESATLCVSGARWAVMRCSSCRWSTSAGRHRTTTNLPSCRMCLRTE
jgi:hypothetical protein